MKSGQWFWAEKYAHRIVVVFTSLAEENVPLNDLLTKFTFLIRKEIERNFSIKSESKWKPIECVDIEMKSQFMKTFKSRRQPNGHIFFAFNSFSQQKLGSGLFSTVKFLASNLSVHAFVWTKIIIKAIFEMKYWKRNFSHSICIKMFCIRLLLTDMGYSWISYSILFSLFYRFNAEFCVICCHCIDFGVSKRQRINNKTEKNPSFAVWVIHKSRIDTMTWFAE